MQLYIMRHGQAEAFGSSDSQRALTEQGELEALVMAKWLNSEHIAFDQLYISPYKRAQQTAAIVNEHLNITAKTETLSLITPMGSAQSVQDYIDGVCQSERIESLLIVSHMPLVSYLVDILTIDQNAPIFQTAGIAHIDYDLKRMKGRLLSMISPNDLC